MVPGTSGFDINKVIHEIKHYLPSQAPLKDFIHHNTLHAFQHEKFHHALYKASRIFGYKTYLHIDEYRNRYKDGKINDSILNKVIQTKYGSQNIEFWRKKMLHDRVDESMEANIGSFNHVWIEKYHLNLNKLIHPPLFRIVANYLDQGISVWKFPRSENGFLDSLRELEKQSLLGLFRTKKPHQLLLNTDCSAEGLLKLVVGNENLFEHFLFDQQFAHPGWSGMVSVLESNKNALIDQRKISLHDFIVLELLLTIDQLEHRFGSSWKPMNEKINSPLRSIFHIDVKPDSFEILSLWQDALEWNYYNQVLDTIRQNEPSKHQEEISFQALFCIDDRSCSLRRYIEEIDPTCSTYGTPGFFNVEFYYQPVNGKHLTKACPAPVNPKFLIKENSQKFSKSTEEHFSRNSNSLFSGWLFSQTIGFWSAIKLAIGIFKPSKGPTCVRSETHVQPDSELKILNVNPNEIERGLQIGFTIEQMADRIEGLLKGIGLTQNFASIVYLIGHGASSLNNTHYAGYDCGACSGRPGSINARVAAWMANQKGVRDILSNRGIQIPEQVQFVAGLHDTTRDEILFYSLHDLSDHNKKKHLENRLHFDEALNKNAVERSRRFELMSKKISDKKIHPKVKLRSVSLFEPRPEYNHATNALCIIGRRSLTKNLFLDRRAFLNSYDGTSDKDGKNLLNILKAAAPVCGGINLEYYFSRVDNQRLGAGTKLPHNVIGLIGVANGLDGDLRTGLPWQMVEIHEPLRLLMIVEQDPEIILKVLSENPQVEEWFLNCWIHLISIHPQTKEIKKYVNGDFNPYVITSIDKIKISIENLKTLNQDINPFILECHEH